MCTFAARCSNGTPKNYDILPSKTSDGWRH